MKKRNTSKKSLTDWQRIEAMTDQEIDLSDCPEITPEMFAKAVVKRGLKPAPNKAQLTLRLDRDVLTWFKQQGRGYQPRINALLRAYMEAHKLKVIGKKTQRPSSRKRKTSAIVF
ncbi:MAG: BrnA antitoxin family protein [Acidobacteria bacterium]|nr:BrnA antitoxin family protein [Acidobacteriota bacterium]MBI3658366.1 BrnA antitoxin family protein [Acidobacteriota bacterium]